MYKRISYLARINETPINLKLTKGNRQSTAMKNRNTPDIINITKPILFPYHERKSLQGKRENEINTLGRERGRVGMQKPKQN